MPIKSKVQQRFMFSQLKAPTTKKLGAVAREFIAATPKSAYKKLPNRAKQKR
jgi:hypothetical protein